MTFVVGEDCIKCKHTDCVEVCPVDCFYEGPNFLVIHPDECIDCALCEPECPVDAIYSEISPRGKSLPLTQRTGPASRTSWSFWSASNRRGPISGRRTPI